MTTLFDATRPVNRNKSFAAGLTAPARRPEPTEADRAWWAATTLRTADDFEVEGEPRLYGRALDAARLEAYERGFLPL